MPEQHREHQQLLFYTPKNCSERLSGNVAILELVHRSMEHRREARIGWKQPVTSRRLRRLRTLDRMPISSHSSEPAIDPLLSYTATI
jgi:hypothetical protein